MKAIRRFFSDYELFLVPLIGGMLAVSCDDHHLRWWWGDAAVIIAVVLHGELLRRYRMRVTMAVLDRFDQAFREECAKQGIDTHARPAELLAEERG